MRVMVLHVIRLSCLIRVSMKMVKLTVTLKSERVIKLEKKTMVLSILRLETKLLKLLTKLKLSASVNVKPNKSKKREVWRKTSQFCKLSYSRILWWYWTKHEWCNTMLYVCGKQLNLNLEINRKRKPDKNKIPQWKINWKWN